ncbi:glutathione synthase [Pelagibacterales bacterium]|nr:glutathione synthase [Pelagibacterales bacterium]MDB9986067.1 glutathione synthase [Pelagibacterales bacterium]
MNVAFQMDKLSNINFNTDSTIALIFESQLRNNKNYIYTPDDLFIKNNEVFASASLIVFNNKDFTKYKTAKKKIVKLSIMGVIFIRQDPPYDMAYITSLHILELIDAKKTRIINDPLGIRNSPEKILIFDFPELIPPTIVTRSKDQVIQFLKNYKKAVIKPLYGNGGEGIFLISNNDLNLNQIIESFISNNKEQFIVQKYLPEIIKGDKRIILVDGEPVGAIARIPKVNEIRSNIHVGGIAKKIMMSKSDRLICSTIGPELKKRKLFFVGIDIIGENLIEINVTSPTCIREIKQHSKLDIAKIIWDKLA